MKSYGFRLDLRLAITLVVVVGCLMVAVGCTSSHIVTDETWEDTHHQTSQVVVFADTIHVYDSTSIVFVDSVKYVTRHVYNDRLIRDVVRDTIRDTAIVIKRQVDEKEVRVRVPMLSDFASMIILILSLSFMLYSIFNKNKSK